MNHEEGTTKWTVNPKGAIPLEKEQQNENVVPLENEQQKHKVKKKNNKVKAKWMADPKGVVPLKNEQQSRNVVPLRKGTTENNKIVVAPKSNSKVLIQK